MCNSIQKLMPPQQGSTIQKGPLAIGYCLPGFQTKAVISTEIDTLQTAELTACGWNSYEQTLTAKLKKENGG